MSDANNAMSDANNAPSPPASVASTLPGPLSPAGVAAEVDAAFASDAELRVLVRQRRVTFKAVRARVAARLGVDEALLKEKALKAALRDAAVRAIRRGAQALPLFVRRGETERRVTGDGEDIERFLWRVGQDRERP